MNKAGTDDVSPTVEAPYDPNHPQVFDYDSTPPGFSQQIANSLPPMNIRCIDPEVGGIDRQGWEQWQIMRRKVAQFMEYADPSKVLIIDSVMDSPPDLRLPTVEPWGTLSPQWPGKAPQPSAEPFSRLAPSRATRKANKARRNRRKAAQQARRKGRK